ncbi:MAG: hypothetical protein ACYTDW_01345 [Planctomycetota bacterium]
MRKDYKTFVRTELDCGDTLVARRVSRQSRWKVQIYRGNKMNPVAEFTVISTTENLREIRGFLRRLGDNTPPSYRS